MRLGAVILAAGESSRMGRPKALLRWKGETFVDRLVSALAPVAHPVVVVLGYGADEIRAGVERADRATFERNPDPSRGMLSSLQTGLAALPSDLDGFLFTTVDSPAVSHATVAKLAAAVEGGALIAIPRYQNRNGHPTACAMRMAGEFLALDPRSSPKEAIRRHEAECVRIDVDDPGVLADIDTPQEYESLLAGAAR